MKVELNWKIVLALFLLLAGTFITASRLLENPEITISVNNEKVEFENKLVEIMRNFQFGENRYSTRLLLL